MSEPELLIEMLPHAVSGLHPSHKTRFSFDASSYDEICMNCGATDQVPGGWGQLAYPCPKASAVDRLAEIARDKEKPGAETRGGQVSDRLLELVFSAEAADADVGRFVRELAAEADREGLSLVFTTAPKDGQTPKISRELTVDFLRDAAGDIVTRTYEIPYRPQYVLTFAPGAATGQAVAVPTGPWWEHDVPGFRFHLSPEALKLVAAQGADPERGFTRIEVVWDATDAGPVLLKAMQGVTKAQEVTA